MNFRILLPLLIGAAMLQLAVPLVRVATSYRAVELDMPVAQVGLLASAFALLPAVFAVHVGRYNDRHGEADTALLGAAIVCVAVLGLWLGHSNFTSILIYTCLLGIGQVMSISAQQMMTTRCSSPEDYDRVLGMFLVATAAGQVLGPLVIGLTTPSGSLFPDARLYWLVVAAAGSLLACASAAKVALPSEPRSTYSSSIGLGTILRTPGLVIIIVSSSVCLATNDLMIVFFPVLGAERGIDAATVGLLLSLRAVSSMLSRFAFFRLTQRVGKIMLLMLSLLSTALATGALVLPMPIWLMAIFLTASGFMMGLAIACSLSLTLGMAPAGGKATAMSLRLTASRLGQFVLPLGAGLAASLLGPGSIFAFMGAGLFACGVLARTIPKGHKARPSLLA